MDISKFPFEKLEKEKSRLASLRKYEALVSDTDAELNRIVKIAAYICKTPISLVNLIEANHTIFKAAIGTDLKGSPREISFCSVAIQGNGILEIPDTLQDERFKDNPLVTGPTSIRFYAGAPLINSEGQNMGTLCLFDNKPKELSEEQKEILDTLARQVVMHMELLKQKQTLQTANLSLVLKLQNNISELQKELESCKKLIPQNQILHATDKTITGNLQKAWLIACSIPELLSPVNDKEPGVISKFLQSFYSELNKIISAHAGFIYQYNENGIKGYFIDPNAFPYYNKNALYCAFEILEQAEKIINAAGNLQVKLKISLHAGDIIYGDVADLNLPAIITGSSFNVIKSLEENVPADNNVVITSQALEQVKDSVIIKREFTIPLSPFKSYTVYGVEKNNLIK